MADGRDTEAEKAERCALAKCPLAGQGDARCARCTGPVAWRDARGVRHGRARSCHGCPMDGLGLPVCWAACPGPRTDFSADGQSVVCLGAMAGQEGAAAFVEANTAYDARLARLPRADYVTGLPPETETALLKLLRIFADMTERQVLLVHAMLNGKSQSGAARRGGVSKQAASMAVIRLMARHPELAPFFRWTSEAHRGDRGAE